MSTENTAAPQPPHPQPALAKSNFLAVKAMICAVVGLAIVGLALWGGPTHAAVEPSKSAGNTTGNTNELHTLVIGHSLIVCLDILQPLAPMVGHTGYQAMRYTIPGAGIGIHYQAEWPHWQQRYFAPDKKWDVLIMSARDVRDDAEFAPKFAAEAFKNNPKCQVFIYGNWPAVYDVFDKTMYAFTEEYLERVGAAVDKAFPQAPKTRIMPICTLVRELREMADRGELPGVKDRFALFKDQIHPDKLCEYAVNVLVMAMLYNESPLNYPSDIYPVDAHGRPDRTHEWLTVKMPEETATVIKQLAWDILQTYPPAGMKPSLIIGNRHLEIAIAGQPYKVELKALNANGSCGWSFTKGVLPPGMSLATDGAIAGQSTAVGDYPLTMRLTDGKSCVERPLVLSVQKDTPLLIPNQSLPVVPLDRYVMQLLKVEGGIGHITWSVSQGKLPHGVMLSSAGMLVGTPGESGEFAFTVKAEDSFPTGPRSSEKAFSWTIGPVSPEALAVKYLVATYSPKERKLVTPDCTVDGKVDETFWKLDQAIAKKVSGTPTKKAFFDVVWTASIAPNTKELVGDQLILACKVLDGPKGKTPKDGIHIFLDGNHNQSLIYSSDDTHLFIPRTYKGGGAQRISGKAGFHVVGVQEIEGGYSMEIALLGKNYFFADGNWVPFGLKGVYGLDIAVDEGDDKEVSQQVWRGDTHNAEDTSHFGTILLVNEPAVTSTNKITTSQ